LAGSGNPWYVLKDKNYTIILSLHEDLELNVIADSLNITNEQLIYEIDTLIKYSLITKKNNNYYPNIFISNNYEVEKVYKFSKSVGIKLSEVIIEDWDILKKSYKALSISNLYSFKELGFMLVGSRILDMGVLGALVLDQSLLLPPRNRPSPSRPDACYYFWLIEGKHEHLGKYGQNDTDLKWDNWHILNFGQNRIDRKLNSQRRVFQKKINEMQKSDTIDNPLMFAECLKVPYLSKMDSKYWLEVSNKISNDLLNVLKNNEQEIKDFYKTLRTGEYSNNSFSDFFCWFYHVVFAWTIDDLQEKGYIDFPTNRFSGIVLYREGDEGLLIK